MSINPGFESLENRRVGLLANAENSARYASSFITYKTTGWGEFLADEAEYFTTTFTERPAVSHSFSMDGDTLVEGRFPRITAGVHEWVRDANGLYTGAWLFFVVETMGVQGRPTYVLPTSADASDSIGLVTSPVPIPDDPDYEILHSFTFTGVAMKAIPVHILTDT